MQAQNKPTLEYQVKAVFLYNFTHFINWPNSAFSSSKAPFVIGIVGEDPFGSYLNEIVDGEMVGERQIVIHRYRAVKDIDSCQILFVNIRESLKVKEILSKIDQSHTLTVSDADQFIKWGGEMCFYKEDNKIRIQINMAATKGSQLEISSKLLRTAKIL